VGQPYVEDGKDETSAARKMAASVAPCIKTNPNKIKQIEQTSSINVTSNQILLFLLFCFFYGEERG